MSATHHFIASLFCVLVSGCNGQVDPVVDIDGSASVRGVEEYLPNSNTPVYNFNAIPYAAPPIDDLRFLPPREVPLWSGELDGELANDVCPMVLPVPGMSEDCLHLNIWTPTLDPSANLTVMVWIYGGAFVVGDSDAYEGTEIAALGNVVFVNFNYRVGMMGFFTTGNDDAPGNAGLWDQRMALQWVQRHITRFGGNPNQVTIFGNSAGGISVNLQMISPQSRGLYQRAISQSGVGSLCGILCVNPRAVERERSIAAAREMGCDETTSEEIVACLRNMDWEDVEQHPFNHVPGPHIDGTFIPDWPLNSYNMGEFDRVDYLLGFNQDDGYLFAFEQDPTRENIRQLMRDYLSPLFPENTDAILNEVMNIYVNFENFTTDGEFERAYTNMLGDLMFIGTSTDFARKHSAHARTYLYHFNHRPHWDETSPSWVTSDHATEIPYVFGEPFGDTALDFSDEGRILSRRIMTYWANFARTGDPNGDGLPRWDAVRCGDRNYLELVSNPRQRQNFEPRRMDFWMNTIYQLDISRNPTYRGLPWSCPAS